MYELKQVRLYSSL